MPEKIEIVLIKRPEAAPSGAAEMALGLVPAAIGNAVFDATGVRLRRVPFTPERVKAALEQRLAAGRPLPHRPARALTRAYRSLKRCPAASRDCQDRPGDDALIHAPRPRPHRSCRARSRRGRRALSRGSASPSGRATGIPGAPTITSSSCPASSSNCSAVAEPEKLGGDGFADAFRRVQSTLSHAARGLSFLMLESERRRGGRRRNSCAGVYRHRCSHVRARRRPARRQPERGSASRSHSHATRRRPRSALRSASSLNPEKFWNPALQQHANSANDIAGAVLVAENPSDHHIFLSAFTAASANCTRRRAGSPRRRRAATSGSWTRPRFRTASGAGRPTFPRARASRRCALR